MTDLPLHLQPYRIRMWDSRAEVYRDATQSDLDLALERVAALSQYRAEVQALTDEMDERLALLTRKHASR